MCKLNSVIIESMITELKEKAETLFLCSLLRKYTSEGRAFIDFAGNSDGSLMGFYDHLTMDSPNPLLSVSLRDGSAW